MLFKVNRFSTCVMIYANVSQNNEMFQCFCFLMAAISVICNLMLAWLGCSNDANGVGKACANVGYDVGK